MFIGLNPSTADEYEDDPTVRRCIGFAKRWGFGQLILTNLFACKSKDPRALREVEDPVGPSNDEWLIHSRERADRVIAAWGNGGRFNNRDEMVLDAFPGVYCLSETKLGAPRHPLYLSYAIPPTLYRR